MLDQDGIIVEPGVRKRIRKYFKQMGLREAPSLGAYAGPVDIEDKEFRDEVMARIDDAGAITTVGTQPLVVSFLGDDTQGRAAKAAKKIERGKIARVDRLGVSVSGRARSLGRQAAVTQGTELHVRPLSEDVNGFYERIASIDKSSEKVGILVKRAWNAEADHSFMRTVQTVHWFHYANASIIIKMLYANGKDEIATSGYLPGERLYPTNWAEYFGDYLERYFVGLLVRGRITYAASDMNVVHSGYHTDDDSPVISRWHSSSGIPRRPFQYTLELPEQKTILDRQSFESLANDYDINEFIVDNWRPISLITSTRSRASDFAPGEADSIKEALRFKGVTVIDIDGKKLGLDEVWT